MNYLVWRRGLRGPLPSLDLLDPRASMEWEVNQQTTIAVIPLAESERAITLDEAIAAHPCPEVANA
jgi:hypothetical protein